MPLDEVPSPEHLYRTASATMIRALEEFGDSEARAVVIIHTNEKGQVMINSNAGRCSAIGMMRTAEHMILTGEA